MERRHGKRIFSKCQFSLRLGCRESRRKLLTPPECGCTFWEVLLKHYAARFVLARYKNGILEEATYTMLRLKMIQAYVFVRSKSNEHSFYRYLIR